MIGFDSWQVLQVRIPEFGIIVELCHVFSLSDARPGMFYRFETDKLPIW